MGVRAQIVAVPLSSRPDPIAACGTLGQRGESVAQAAQHAHEAELIAAEPGEPSDAAWSASPVPLVFLTLASAKNCAARACAVHAFFACVHQHARATKSCGPFLCPLRGERGRMWRRNGQVVRRVYCVYTAHDAAPVDAMHAADEDDLVLSECKDQDSDQRPGGK